MTRVIVSEEAWEAFNEAVDNIGWTDTDSPEFPYALHRGFQTLRALLRQSVSITTD